MRIWVVGTSGSGKSTVAAALAGILGVPHVELDALHWLPAWEARPTSEFRALLAERLAADGWVVDGNYTDYAQDLVWPRVEQAVWLDLPRSEVMRQVVTRTLGRWARREVLWGTNRESLRMSLLSRDSILWWAWSTHARRRRQFEARFAAPPFPVVRLRSRAEVDRWLAAFARRPYAPATRP